MDLRGYVNLIRQRWVFVTTCVVVGLLAAVAAVLLLPPTYSAQAQIFVATSDENPGNAYQGGLFAQQRVTSYVQVVNSPEVMRGVISTLRLNTTPQQLAHQISAVAPLDTVLINVKATGSSAGQAQVLANTTANQFTQFVSGIERPALAGTPPVRATVVGSANLPTSPTSPKPSLYLPIGLLVGLALGIGGAVLRATLDTRVRKPDDISRYLGLAPLGVIPRDRKRRGKRLGTLGVIPLDPSQRHHLHVEGLAASVQAEAFRKLRANLQFASTSSELKSIVVSSAVRGEGKTSTVVNLGLSLAQTGLRIVLVDADLRMPQLAESVGIDGAVGLTSVVNGDVSLDQALQGDGLLRVLPSGPQPVDPTGMLASSQMQEVLRALESKAGLVIVDSPAVLPFADAAVVGAEASGTLVVVRADKTRREEVSSALDGLAALNANVLGIVLNMVPGARPEAERYGYPSTGRRRARRFRPWRRRARDQVAWEPPGLDQSGREVGSWPAQRGQIVGTPDH